MSGIENYPSFIIAVMIFQLIPGAGTIAILNATARSGIGGGMGAVLGTLSGDFLYMLAAVLGLAALLAAHPAVLSAVQWVGVAYLCRIGVQLFIEKAAPEERPGAPEAQTGQWAWYRQGLAVSLTNPKVILFFVAFFPLFLGAQSTVLSLVALMIQVTLLSLCYQTALVFAGKAVATRLARWGLGSLLAKRLAGVALIGCAIRLALNIW